MIMGLFLMNLRNFLENKMKVILDDERRFRGFVGTGKELKWFLKTWQDDFCAECGYKFEEDDYIWDRETIVDSNIGYGGIYDREVAIGRRCPICGEVEWF